jgi:AcrR family transcriptional regulator
MAPRHVDRAEKAGSIARTALVLFSEKGYRATSVGQIAREAGIGKGTVYDYFETKEDIFIAAVMEWLGQFEDNLMVRLEGLEDPIERLYAVARMHKELYGSIDSNTMHLFLQILQQSMMPGGIIAKRRHLVQEMAATATRTMANVLLEGVARGVFRPEMAASAETIAVNLHAFLDGIGLHSIVSGKTFDLERQIDFYMDHLIRSITKDKR